MNTSLWINRHARLGLLLLSVMALVVAGCAPGSTDSTGSGFDSTLSDSTDQEGVGNTPDSADRISFVWWGPYESLSVDDESSEEPDYRYIIPAGAGEAIDAGEEVEILPSNLEVLVGETIEIINEDDRLHFAGPFTVGQGEMLRQRFSAPGVSLGACSAHVLGSFEVVVLEA